MKKNILSIFCCLSLLTLASCSDDYNDASTKHVYGENEDPYLKVDEDAQITRLQPSRLISPLLLLRLWSNWRIMPNSLKLNWE